MLTNQERVIVLFLVGASACGLAVSYHRGLQTSPATPILIEKSQEEDVEVCVDVSGAVWKPGVYKLKKGVRISDVLEMAMLRPDADLDAINRAALVRDGQKIVVPVKGSSTSNYQKKVNINLASKEELQTLPNIGEVRSRDIIHYRKQHGPFATIEELKNIPGIGHETFERLKDFIVAE